MADGMTPGVALVTGAGRRVGRAIATALAEDGWAVALHHNRSADDAEELRAWLAAQGGMAATVQADLADAAAAQRLVTQAADALGQPVSLLVNNASLFQYDTAGTADAASFNAHMSTNALAPLLLSQAMAADLPEERTGLIVNMLDNKVFNLNPDFLSYTVSKVALHGITELLTLALAPRIRVAGIAPGVTLISGKQTQESFERSHRFNLLGRGATVPEIVAALRFLIAAPSVTGQTIVLDGGQSKMRQERDVAFLTGTRDPGEAPQDRARHG